MSVRLTTKLRAYPKMFPSILEDYVKKIDNPTKDAIYGMRNNEWVEIVPGDISIRYGSSPFCVIVDNTHDTVGNTQLIPANCAVITSLTEMKVPMSLKASTLDIIIDMPKDGYCWICSSVPLNSINDKATGWVIDYRKQKDNVVMLNEDGTETTYFCYVTDLLKGGAAQPQWKFNISLQGDDL